MRVGDISVFKTNDESIILFINTQKVSFLDALFCFKTKLYRSKTPSTI